jgi:cytochrome o ubiquinol oxidase subunit I
MNLFGALSLSEVPLNQPIIMAAVGLEIVAVLAVLGAISFYRKWGYLWREWLTSVDHKKIGVMYLIVAMVMLLRGFIDALMMRAQQSIAAGGNPGFLPPDHYDQFFSEHGVIMIFFMAMPFMVGLTNIAVPLQIGARDVAFPFLNSVSLWFLVAGAILLNVSLGLGNFARAGWLAYPPLSELKYSPDVGMNYYLWALQLSGFSTLFTGINFFVTIIRMRAPGMNFMRMPLFTWTILCTMVLIMAAFPILTVALSLLTLDRYAGMHFFTDDLGGNAMMYVNLIWAWGHPEVYILMLPAFGVFSEVVPTFAEKPLFGYPTMVYATLCITVLSFMVWLHHFFTMGSGANVNAFFGIMTMIIAVPTGVKIFSWLFTIYRGRLRFGVPVLWTLGFMVTFTIGGMTGVLLAMPGADFVLHNSLFLVAHFHNVLIGGVLFGFFAGLNYWFPKAFGFTLDEKLGRRAFWFWITGFYVAFMPLYVLGFMGMTRRMQHYDNPAWQPYFILAAFGAILILIGIGHQVAQLVVSIRDRERNRDLSGDPWNGRTLEWATSSPPPFYNFAVVPEVDHRDAFWELKTKGAVAQHAGPYDDIEMPKSTPAGLFIGILGGIFAFAMIWYIWWLAILGFLGMVAVFIWRSCDDEIDYIVTGEEIAAIEGKPDVHLTSASEYQAPALTP